MGIVATAKDGEIEKLNQTIRRTVRLCKVIWEYRDYIEEIKGYIDREELVGAAELWNELDYAVQKYLIIAPRYGGAFTTEERALIKGFWEISESDLTR